MSQADDILNGLTVTEHNHVVTDDDKSFTIDTSTRKIIGESRKKYILIQGDHNSERYTFTIPRFIEGHDTALCNVIQIPYINIEDAEEEPRFKTGVYTVSDLKINDDNTVTFTWLISKNATKFVGTMSFMLLFSCIQGIVVTYRWGTDSFDDVLVLTSKDGHLQFETEYIDIIEQWKESVKTQLIEYIDAKIAEYKTATTEEVISKLKSEITSFERTFDGALRTEISSMTNEINLLKERMNTFASLAQGSTTGDAELTDARIDFEGITEASVGNAFRKMTEKLYLGYKKSGSVYPDHTTFITRGSNNLFSKRTCFIESWTNSSGIISMQNHFVSDYIPCVYGEVYSCTSPITFGEVHYFDEHKNRLGNLTINAGTTSFVISHKTARYFVFQSENVMLDTLMINRGPTLLDYEEWDGFYKLNVELTDIDSLFDARKYFHISKNLFVRDTIKENTWFNKNNGFIKLNGYFTTDYINIEPGKYILSTKKLPDSPGAVEIHIFDENYTQVKQISLNNLCGPSNANYILDIAYDDYKYMVFQMNMNYVDVEFAINRGEDLTEYEPGGEYLITDYVDLSEIFNRVRDEFHLGEYEIVLPDRIYLRNNGVNEQYNLYFDSVFNGKKPPIIDVVCNYGKQLEECWRYETNASGFSKANGSFELTIKGLDEQLNVLVSKTVTVTVVTASSTDPIVYLAIGDSITSQGHYVAYSEDKVRNLTSIGTMSAIGEDYYREGKSGWSLNNYLNNIGTEAYSSEFSVDSPFLYPVGYSGASYKGNTSQIKSIVEGRGTYILPFMRKQYMTNGVYDYDANGYFKNPKIGDYMCDPTLENKWVMWNGTEWAMIPEQPTEFEFSFAKYMDRYSDMFGGKTPTHVSICLGANDFQQNTPTEETINTWYTNLLTVINSIKEYDSNIKIILFAPPIGSDQDAWGMQLNSGATSHNYYKNLKLLEKVLISKHDEANNIFVVPVVEMVDTEYAYDRTVEKRNVYTNETVSRQNNWVHPNATVGHNQMSDALLGVFEKTR